MADRMEMMSENLMGIQSDLGLIKRGQVSQGIGRSSSEDHIKGLMTSTYGVQSAIADLKMRVDRIERRLGLTDTEH